MRQGKRPIVTVLTGGRESYNMHDAKTQLSRIVARVEEGEEVLLCRDGIPLAMLAPYRPYAATGADDGTCTNEAHQALSRIIRDVGRGNVIMLVPAGSDTGVEVSVVQVGPQPAPLGVFRVRVDQPDRNEP